MYPSRMILLLGLVAPLALAQVPSLGWCPEYIPVADFNMNRFLGKWYEAERYFTITEVGSRCVTTTYAKGPSGKIFVSNKITNRITGVKRVIDGELQQIGKAGEGRLSVKYTSLPVAYDTSYTVLDTDYENFAVLWACSGIGPVHTQNAWVMTRERLAPGTVLQKAYGVLDQYKISRAFFVKTDQQSCVLTADDLAASNAEPAPVIPEDPVEELEKSLIPATIPVEVVVGDESAAKKTPPVQISEHILGKSALPEPDSAVDDNQEETPAQPIPPSKPIKIDEKKNPIKPKE